MEIEQNTGHISADMMDADHPEDMTEESATEQISALEAKVEELREKLGRKKRRVIVRPAVAAWKDLLPRTMPVTWEYIVKAHRHKQMESSHVIYSPNERNLTFFAEEHLEGIKIWHHR